MISTEPCDHNFSYNGNIINIITINVKVVIHFTEHKLYTYGTSVILVPNNCYS